jgi:predicted nucleic acid-binding protein
MAERTKRLRPAETSRFLALVGELEVEVDAQTATQALGETLALARRHALSAYDAAYLELAIRESLPLATLDEALKRAARRCGVALAGQ